MIKESVRRVLKASQNSQRSHINEVRGWGLEPDDFVIIGGKLDPNKQYELVKIGCSSGLAIPYVVEYDEYFPTMLNTIFQQVGEDDTFRDIQDYIDDVHEMMEDDGISEEEAEASADDVWVACWDYGFAVYAPYGISNSQPMSGVEMLQKINATSGDSWLKR